MTTRGYQWSTAAEWLDDHIGRQFARGSAAVELAAIARLLASRLDADAIQDLFQDDMAADGYFRPMVVRSEEGKT